jgi:nitroreductase
MKSQVLEMLASRRSVKPALLAAPGPAPAELDQILSIASRVPDHKKLAPWRYIVFEGTAREKAGEIFAAACAAEEREPPSPVRLETERGRFMRAPLVVAVVSCVREHRGAPEWEQILSAGASAFNLCLAANAMGYGTSWVTEWIAYSPMVRAGLGLKANERIAGFVYIGTPIEKPDDRERPLLSEVVSRFPG